MERLVVRLRSNKRSRGLGSAALSISAHSPASDSVGLQASSVSYNLDSELKHRNRMCSLHIS
jgi:hypothetical protein